MFFTPNSVQVSCFILTNCCILVMIRLFKLEMPFLLPGGSHKNTKFITIIENSLIVPNCTVSLKIEQYLSNTLCLFTRTLAELSRKTRSASAVILSRPLRMTGCPVCLTTCTNEDTE